MGIAGWNVLAPSMELKGTLRSHHYSGGGGFFSTDDYDSNLEIAPDPQYTHLATNSAGRTNPGGIIECEIHVSCNIPDTSTENAIFEPCVGKPVTLRGVYVEDRSHGNKTEIHPIDSMLADQGQDAFGHHYRFCAFCDAWNWIPAQPTPPPFARTNRTADALIPFPAGPPAPGYTPIFHSNVQWNGADSVSINVLTSGGQTYLHILVHTGLPEDKGFYWTDLTLLWQAPKTKEHKDTKDKEKDKEKEKDHKDGKEKDKDSLKEKEAVKERDVAFEPAGSGWPLAAT